MANSNIVVVDSIDDPRLAPYRQLHNRNVADRVDRFIAEGQLVVDRLMESDYTTESLLVESAKAPQYATLVPCGVPIYSLPRDLIRQVVGFDFHRGVMACGHRSAIGDVDDLRFAHGTMRVALAIMGVSDQENMGSLLRSASALGINQILLGPRTIDPFLRRVIRVSMGSVFKHRLFDLADPVRQLEKFSQNGIRTIASTLAQATDIREFTRDNRPMVLLVGHEANGLDHEVQKIATDRVQIPMRLGTDSLNVSVAAAILMYELTRPTL